MSQHWYLIESLSRASCNLRELVEEQFCESKLLLWPMMTINMHYNRTTTVEKGDKIIALWTSGSKLAQIADEVEDITCPREDMNSIFEFSTRYLTSELRIRVAKTVLN